MSASIVLRTLLGRADATAADLGSVRASSRTDLLRLRRALADTQDFLAAARSWFEKALGRLDALGHPPGLPFVPDLAARLRTQCDELDSLVPVLRVVVSLAGSADEEGVAAMTEVLDGLIASVGRVREGLDRTDIDALERESHAAFDKAFAALAGRSELLRPPDRETGPVVSVSLDVLLDQVDGS